MIFKKTFMSDDEINEFFQKNTDSDKLSTIYIIKYIIVNNPMTRTQEQHLIYSRRNIMKAGMHLRKGNQE